MTVFRLARISGKIFAIEEISENIPKYLLGEWIEYFAIDPLPIDSSQSIGIGLAKLASRIPSFSKPQPIEVKDFWVDRIALIKDSTAETEFIELKDSEGNPGLTVEVKKLTEEEKKKLSGRRSESNMWNKLTEQYKRDQANKNIET